MPQPRYKCVELVRKVWRDHRCCRRRCSVWGGILIYDVSEINKLRSAPVPSISGSGIYSLVGSEEIRKYRVRGYRKLTTRPGTDIPEMMLLADAICIGLLSRTVQIYSHEPC